jgi:lipoate synthase
MNKLFISLPYLASTNNYDKYFPFPMDYLKLRKDGDEIFDGNLESFGKKKEEIYKISDNIVEMIKNTKDKDIFIIAGNYAPDADKGEYFDYILNRINKDIEISGPYTLNTSKLKQIEKNRNIKIKVIPYVDTSGVNIPDEMIERYPGDKKRVTMRISVGCARSCAYCPVVPIHNKRYKFHEIEPVVEQIKKYYERGVRQVVFIDDNISLHKKKFKQLLQCLKKENFKGMRFISLEGLETYIFEDEDICQLLKETRWDNIKTGMENISEDFLKKVDKYYTSFEVIETAMENIQKYKLDVSVYFLIGLDETEEVVMENIKFLSKYHLGVRVNILRPYENGLLDFDSFERKMTPAKMKSLSSLAYAASWLGTNHKIDMFEEGSLEKILSKCKLELEEKEDTFRITGKVYIGFKTSKLIKVLQYVLSEIHGEVKRTVDNKEEIIFEKVKTEKFKNNLDLFV